MIMRKKFTSLKELRKEIMMAEEDVRNAHAGWKCAGIKLEDAEDYLNWLLSEQDRLEGTAPVVAMKAPVPLVAKARVPSTGMASAKFQPKKWLTNKEAILKWLKDDNKTRPLERQVFVTVTFRKRIQDYRRVKDVIGEGCEIKGGCLALLEMEPGHYLTIVRESELLSFLARPEKPEGVLVWPLSGDGLRAMMNSVACLVTSAIAGKPKMPAKKAALLELQGLVMGNQVQEIEDGWILKVPQVQVVGEQGGSKNE